MANNQFILTKEHLIEWLSDPAYMEEYKAQVYQSILKFYFDTFFADIYPAKRAILEIEKDLGISIEKELLLHSFYFDYWSRKRKKEKARENSISKNMNGTTGSTERAKDKEKAATVQPQSNPAPSQEKGKSVAETTKPTFDFKDAKEITGGNKPLYVGKKQRARQAEEDDKTNQK